MQTWPGSHLVSCSGVTGERDHNPAKCAFCGSLRCPGSCVSWSYCPCKNTHTRNKRWHSVLVFWMLNKHVIRNNFLSRAWERECFSEFLLVLLVCVCFDLIVSYFTAVFFKMQGWQCYVLSLKRFFAVAPRWSAYPCTYCSCRSADVL